MNSTMNYVVDYHIVLQTYCCRNEVWKLHDDVIKWKHFPCSWPFVPGIPQPPVNSPHKGQWCWGLMFSLICAWINSWANNGDTSDLGCHCAHHDVTVTFEKNVDNRSSFFEYEQPKELISIDHIGGPHDCKWLLLIRTPYGITSLCHH